MKLFVRTLPMLLVLLAAGLACSLFSAGGQLNSGNPAPDFQLVSSQGNTYKLSDFQGHPVLLNFWATWCGPCVEEMPQIQRIFDAYRPYGLVVFAVSSEDLDKVAHFGADNDLNFPLLVDAKSSVSSQYHISAFPTSYFIDAQGNIQDVVVGSMDRRGFEAHLRPLFENPLPTATVSTIPHNDSLPSLPPSPTPLPTHTLEPDEPGFVILQGCLLPAGTEVWAKPNTASAAVGSLARGDCPWFDGRDLGGAWLHILAGQTPPGAPGWVMTNAVGLQGQVTDLPPLP